MDSEKYIGLDVHQATISVAVLDSTGKLVMESIEAVFFGSVSSSLAIRQPAEAGRTGWDSPSFEICPSLSCPVPATDCSV